MTKRVETKKKKDHPILMPILLPDKWEDDLVRKLRTNPPDFKVVHIDCFKYIGQLPYHIASRIKDAEYRQGYVSVNKSVLASHFHDYRKYLDYLVQYKFLEEDKQYEVGEYSGGLRYPKKYLKQEVVVTQLRKQSLVNNLLRKQKKDLYQDENLKLDEDQLLEGLGSRECSHLSKWIPGLEIDESKALKILAELLEKERLDPAKYKPKKKWKVDGWKVKRRRPKPDDYDYIENRHKLRCVMVKQMVCGIHQKTGLDKKVGRFHSCLTRLNKSFRPAMTYKGQKLVSVDVKNSQPFCLIGLLDPIVFRNCTLYNNIFTYNRHLAWNISQGITEGAQSQSIDEIIHKDQSTTYNTHIYLSYSNNDVSNTDVSNKISNRVISTTMIVNYLLQLVDNQDVKMYFSWVQSGRFYEYFGEELVLRKLIPKNCPNPRKKAKDVTFIVLFGKNDSVKKVKKAVRAFREVFPSIFAVTEMVKFGDPADRPHATLACTLQAFEADIILNHCCGILETEYPYLPIFTIHDSIITTEGNEHIVQEVMRRTFEKIMGYVPEFKVERWV